MNNTTPSATLIDTANRLRAALRAAFPGEKFSVTTRKGFTAAIHVAYTGAGGPSAEAVWQVTHRFERSEFGGLYGQDRVATTHTIELPGGVVARPGADYVFVNPWR